LADRAPKPAGDPRPAECLAGCEAALHYAFQDKALLERCLTHASIARTRLESNERLEFLGDAILGAIVCEILYRQFPEETEGEMTRIKSAVVSRTACARYSRELELDRFLMLGKGLGGFQSVPSSVMAAVFESLVAGIYLDGGYPAAFSFVERMVQPEIQRIVASAHGDNFKSLLQQYVQKTQSETPVYTLLDEKGPDHSKCFEIAVTLGDRQFASAWGPNKKVAEQRAAENAWCELHGLPIPHGGTFSE
jgi:ribonuclease-3